MSAVNNTPTYGKRHIIRKGKGDCSHCSQETGTEKSTTEKGTNEEGSRKRVATDESSDESADESDQTRQRKRKRTKKASNTDDDEVVEQDKEPEIETEVLEIGDDDGGDLQDDSEVSFS